MADELSITVFSSPQHERLVAEIYLAGQFIGFVSEETPGRYQMSLSKTSASQRRRCGPAVEAAIERLKRLDGQ